MQQTGRSYTVTTVSCPGEQKNNGANVEWMKWRQCRPGLLWMTLCDEQINTKCIRTSQSTAKVGCRKSTSTKKQFFNLSTTTESTSAFTYPELGCHVCSVHTGQKANMFFHIRTVADEWSINSVKKS